MFLKDKVIAITGTSSGIGEALVDEALQQGAYVSGLARRGYRLKSKETQDKRFLGFTGDITLPSSLTEWRSQILQKWGRIDILIANAGFSVAGAFQQLDLADYRRQFEVNIFGSLQTIKTFATDLEQSKGSLTILGSINSYVSLANASPYAMSKFAIRALSESLYHEWKEKNISVTLICPGFVESEIRQVDNQGRMHPEDPDPVPAFLLMPKAKAAKKILRATHQRKREVILSFGGWLGIILKRYTPGFFHLALQFFKIKSGKQKSKRAQLCEK